MIEKIKNYFLNKEIKNNTKRRNKSVCSLDSAKSIGIICQISSEESYKEYYSIFSQLHTSSCSLWLIGYIDDTLVPFYCLQQLTADFFCRKNLNWYGKPNFIQLNDFLEKKFDILIDFTVNPLPPIQYCLQLSQAKFIVGSSIYNKNIYDLFIDNSNVNSNNLELLKNIRLYTSKLSGK